MPPRSIPLDVARLRVYVAQGMTVAAIAKRTGRCKPAIYKAIYDLGLAVNGRSKS
jgi:transposase